MNKETKAKIAYRVTVISGIFCGVVALLLILNFWHMKKNEPLESAAIEALLNRLSQEPDNEVLQKEIRSFDLLARKAYFTGRWQVKTGSYLLLISGIILAVSIKVYTDLRATIEKPEEITEEILRARANAQYWLFMGGGLVLGLALLAAYLNNDYLREYQARGPGDESGNIHGRAQNQPQSQVEVIEVIPGLAAGNADSSGIGPGTTGEPAAGQPGQGETPGGEMVAGETAARVVRFNPEDYKTNHATFRGYMGQGISYQRNIPVNWNGSSGERIKWKVAYSKPGFSSPVIWGDNLFISGGDEAARVVSCYNRFTGQLLWEREVSGIPGSPATMPKVSQDTGLAAPTMAVDGNRVYAIFATGDVVAFDMEGNMVWGRNLGVPNNHYGHSSSLQVWENKLVVQYDTNTRGRMLALNTSSGETVWDVARQVHISWASPVLAEIGGKIQILTTSDPYVCGNDLETGEELWKAEGMMGEVAPSVAFENGLVFATNEYARLIAIEPKSDAPFIWEDDEYLAEVASPVAYEGLLYVATSYGVLVCYDARTGEKQWEKEFNDGFYSSPVVADGKVFAMDMGGTMHIFRAGRTADLLSEPTLGEECYTLPAFAEGTIYLRGTEHLFCIGGQ